MSGKASASQTRELNVVRVLCDGQARLHLSDAEIAVLGGVSLPTASALIREGRLPQLTRCLRGLTLLAQRVAVARSRADLGLPS